MSERRWSSDRAIGVVACVLVLAFAPNIRAATSGNEITINSPVNGTVVRGAAVAVRVTLGPDVYWDQLQVDGASVLSGSGNFSWNSTTVANGKHTLMVRVFQKDGTTPIGTAYVSVIVKMPPPHRAAGGAINTSGTAAAKNVIRYEDTYDGIHYFQTFDYKTPNVAELASHAVYVWGSNQSISAYRSSSNPGIILSKYIPFTRDPDWTHNLAYWKSTHPDWVLYKCDRVTPAYEFGESRVPLDISNPAVLAWQVQNYGATASAAGYDAIAADNYALTNVFAACGIYQNGNWKQLYTSKTDPKYTEDVLGWAGAFRARLHALPKPIGLIPNVILNVGGAWNDPRVLSLVAKVDGILDECSFSGCGQTISSWLNVQRLAEYTQSQGKAYFHINEVKSINRRTVQFSLASYLMSKEHAAAIFISGAQQYGADLWRTEYGAPVGTPCDAMRATQGTYMRSFTHGLAIANPGTETVMVTLPAGSFKNIYGADVGSTVTLGPSRGIVLLDKGGPHC